LQKIQFFNELNSLASGGTLETIFESLKYSQNDKSSLGFDPLIKKIGEN